MKKVQKRALVAMISATAFFAGFANAMERRENNPDNLSQFSKGSSDKSEFFKGDVFKGSDPSSNKQEISQLGEKAEQSSRPTNREKKSFIQRILGKDATDGDGDPGYTDSSLNRGAIGSESSDDEDIATSVFRANSNAKEPLPSTPKDFQQKPQVPHELIGKMALSLVTLLKNPANKPDQNEQELEYLSMVSDIAADPSAKKYENILKVLKINNNKIEGINIDENGIISELDGKPVWVRAKYVSTKDGKQRVALSVVPARDKNIAELLGNESLEAIGKPKNLHTRIDILQAIADGHLKYPLPEENLREAIAKPLYKNSRGTLEMCVMFDSDDVTKASATRPESGYYSNTDKFVILQMLQENESLNKARIKAEEAVNHFIDECDKKDAEYQKALQELDAKDTAILGLTQGAKKKQEELDKMADEAGQTKKKLWIKTKCFNHAKKAYNTEKGNTNVLDNYAPASKDGNESDPDV